MPALPAPEKPGDFHPRLTILVVDDDPDYLSVVAELLRDEGYRVVTCNAAQDVLACIQQVEPDGLLLDVRMSGAADWAVFDLVRQQAGTTPLSCVVVSAAIDQLRARQDELRRQGCAVVEKPFELEALLVAVRQTIGPPAG
jgi:two-component system NtrC family response regulator